MSTNSSAVPPSNMATHSESALSRFIRDPKSVAIIGCPFSGGQPKAGVDQGPIHILNAGVSGQLVELGWQVEVTYHHQFKDVDPTITDDPPIGKLKNPRRVSKVSEALTEIVSGHMKRGQLPLTLGGDHSLAMGTITATLRQYPAACVIWIDAHADINTPETTNTGNMHGMPVSFLLGLDKPVKEFGWIKPVLSPKDIVYIGLRDVDAGEKRILKDKGIKAFSMHEVDKYGIGRVVDMALDHVNPGRDRPIHLSFDVDALDPTVAPSTGTPVRGGLTFREGHYICETIYATGCIVAIDIVEVNPSLSNPEDVTTTVSVGCSLARSALGETLL